MMPLADILFLVIAVYVLYRFVNNFLLPVVRATRQVRQQFRNMQGPGNDPDGPQRPGASQGTFGADRSQRSQAANQRSSKPPAEDYIDFEEVK
jgi:hypothetical protein